MNTVTEAQSVLVVGITHDGVEASQCGRIAGSRQSSTQATVTGPDWLTFRRNVSSEENYDFLELHLNGVLHGGSTLGEVELTTKVPNHSKKVRVI